MAHQILKHGHYLLLVPHVGPLHDPPGGFGPQPSVVHLRLLLLLLLQPHPAPLLVEVHLLLLPNLHPHLLDPHPRQLLRHGLQVILAAVPWQIQSSKVENVPSKFSHPPP